MLAQVLSDIRARVEGLTVAEGAPYRLARTAEDVEGRYAERRFVLQVTRRAGPLDTGIEPRVIYDAALILSLVPGGVDGFADAERVALEARDIARALETSNLDVLVGETTFSENEETGVDLAVLALRLVVREQAP